MTGAATTGAGLEFGDELRRYRTAAGLSLRSLARKVGFDFSYLGQVERGERGGSLLLVHRCDTALGASGHLLRVFADQKSRPPRPPEQTAQARTPQLTLLPLFQEACGHAKTPR